MTSPPEQSNLPAQIVDSLFRIPKALVPLSVKALDRLIGATIDIPVAWLNQQRAKIDAQTQSFILVEGAIAKAVADNVGLNRQTLHNAANVLLRDAYRKQKNREAVGAAMVEELQGTSNAENQAADETPIQDLDEDWLNIFERYAEDASTERMQRLWGRVLAGEIRKPGCYSARTLRFLSEFSQADALTFSKFCDNAFGDSAPVNAVRRESGEDIRHLLYLESVGLILGAEGMLGMSLKFNDQGHSFMKENNVVLFMRGEPGQKVDISGYAVTPLGQELRALLQGRNALTAARNVAFAMRTAQIEAAYIMTEAVTDGRLQPVEVLWEMDSPRPTVS